MAAVRQYVAAAVGAVAGLYLGGIAGGLIGAGISSFVTSGGGLETLGPAVVGLVVGAGAGAIAGCWLALRFTAADRAGTSALLLLPILVAAVIIAQLVGTSALAVTSIAPALLTALASILARLIVLAFRPGLAPG